MVMVLSVEAQMSRWLCLGLHSAGKNQDEKICKEEHGNEGFAVEVLGEVVDNLCLAQPTMIDQGRHRQRAALGALKTDGHRLVVMNTYRKRRGIIRLPVAGWLSFQAFTP